MWLEFAHVLCVRSCGSSCFSPDSLSARVLYNFLWPANALSDPKLVVRPLIDYSLNSLSVRVLYMSSRERMSALRGPKSVARTFLEHFVLKKPLVY